MACFPHSGYSGHSATFHSSVSFVEDVVAIAVVGIGEGFARFGTDEEARQMAVYFPVSYFAFVALAAAGSLAANPWVAATQASGLQLESALRPLLNLRPFYYLVRWVADMQLAAVLDISEAKLGQTKPRETYPAGDLVGLVFLLLKVPTAASSCEHA